MISPTHWHESFTKMLSKLWPSNTVVTLVFGVQRTSLPVWLHDKRKSQYRWPLVFNMVSITCRLLREVTCVKILKQVIFALWLRPLGRRMHWSKSFSYQITFLFICCIINFFSSMHGVLSNEKQLTSFSRFGQLLDLRQRLDNGQYAWRVWTGSCHVSPVIDTNIGQSE